MANRTSYVFLSTMVFFLRLFHKAQMCRVHNVYRSCGQILPPDPWISAAPPEWPWVSWLLLWPVLSLLDPAVGWTATFWTYPFYFWMMDWTVLFGMLKAWGCYNLTCFKLLHDFISGLSGEVLGLHDAICSLVYSNKPLKPSQNSCIHTETKLPTAGLY